VTRTNRQMYSSTYALLDDSKVERELPGALAKTCSADQTSGAIHSPGTHGVGPTMREGAKGSPAHSAGLQSGVSVTAR